LVIQKPLTDRQGGAGGVFAQVPLVAPPVLQGRRLPKPSALLDVCPEQEHQETCVDCVVLEEQVFVPKRDSLCPLIDSLALAAMRRVGSQSSKGIHFTLIQP